MTDIQEIFNRVIDQEYYDTSWTYATMCHSLGTAWSDDVITEDECQFLFKEIRDYLRPTDTAYLRKALQISGLPNTIEARTAIYRDWENRPTLTKKVHADD